MTTEESFSRGLAQVFREIAQRQKDDCASLRHRAIQERFAGDANAYQAALSEHVADPTNLQHELTVLHSWFPAIEHDPKDAAPERMFLARHGTDPKDWPTGTLSPDFIQRLRELVPTLALARKIAFNSAIPGL